MPEAALGHEPWKILLVDDDSDDVLLVRDMLSESWRNGGVSVTTAVSRNEALACIDREVFDLCLFDYRLGQDDGLELLAAVRDQGVTTPVIILTGQGDEEIAVAAMKCGAADYIPKRRLTTELLKHAVRYAIELSRTRFLREKAEEALRESEERFRELVTSIPAAVCELDAAGVVLFANPAAAEITGYGIGALAGANWWELLGVDASARTPGGMTAVAAKDRTKRAEISIRARDGREKILNWTVTLRPAKGGPGNLICVGVDITELVRLKEELKELAVTDELTGLLNRRGFLSLAEYQVKSAEREAKDLFLLYADLDDMKRINDNLGHDGGDQALRQAALVLRETFRESDVIGRMGGDEFAVLVASPPGRQSSHISGRLEENLAQHNSTATVPIALSAGVVCRRAADAMDLTELLAAADALMYENKKERKGR